jgi:chemotaxis protein methyltransferase CheR
VKATAGRAKAELEDLEIELLLTAVSSRYGYDFRNYSKASLKRRVRRAVQELEVPTISRLQEMLLHDPAALRRFVATLSVHVTSLFRDPHFYVALRNQVIPILRTYPFLRIWVAGCATGEEVYSLAILLTEEGLYERSQIYATDISDDLLERAAAARFSIDRMKVYTQNYQAALGKRDFSSYYRTHGGSVTLDPTLSKRIVFSQHNVVADGVFNNFQLILCRNVMIYFDQELRERVHRLFHESLCHLGVLGLGLRESLRFTSVADAYEPVDSECKLYRKVR